MLFIYFIIVPVLWVFLGGFCIGVIESLDDSGISIPFELKVPMLLFAPITIVITSVIVLYLVGSGISRKVVSLLKS